MGKTVIPGIIDAHNHIVLVGNRPGWNTAAGTRLHHSGGDRRAESPLRRRSPRRIHHDGRSDLRHAVRGAAAAEPQRTRRRRIDPVFIVAAQGGARVNSAAKTWFEGKGCHSCPVATAPSGMPPAWRCRHCARNSDRRNPQALRHGRDASTTRDWASPPIAMRRVPF